MNLIVDVGNSFVKFAVFLGRTLKKKYTTTLSDFESVLQTIQNDFPKITNAIVSSVGRLTPDHVHALYKNYNLIELSASTKVPFTNCYATPKTLGVDRIALVAASVQQYPDKNVLIIDAGTCITYDFITSKNNYLGGAISPGLQTRYRALHNLTANLPLLERIPPKRLIGNSTKTSIHSGVVYGVVNEIDGFVNEYLKEYQDLTVILTGGDAKFLSKQLKSSIFANPNFLLQGLNFILQYNLS